MKKEKREKKNKNFQCDICQAHIKKALRNSGNGKMKSEVGRDEFGGFFGCFQAVVCVLWLWIGLDLIYASTYYSANYDRVIYLKSS